MQPLLSEKARADFHFGEWRVEAATNSLWKGDFRRQLEPLAMNVLVFLCTRHGQVVTAEELLGACWGTTFQGDNPVHKILSQLRQALGDSATASRYIETIRKRGYRTIGQVHYDAPAADRGNWLHASPFRGLEAFQLEHAPIFFGRESAAERLEQALRQQIEGGCALVALLGPSGAGKSSLVQAGLLPRLIAAPPQGVPIAAVLTLDCADLADVGPFEALGSVLLDAESAGEQVFSGESAVSLGRRLEEGIDAVLAQLRAKLQAARLFLFVDRIEAVFRLDSLGDAPRARFVDVLDQLARSDRILLVVACRNDYYPALMSHPALSALKLRGGHVDLGPPDAAEIARIIRLPAQAAGLRFEVEAASGTGLDELLCHAADKRVDMLPLLAYCLQELYRRRSEDGVLSLAVFHDLGGIDGAIGARAEQVVATLGQAEIDALPRVLSRLVDMPEQPGVVTPRQASWAALQPGPEQELVRALVDARLFVSDLVGGSATYGVAHEAVLRRWPRVVAWIDKHHQTLALRARVGAQAQRWQSQGKASDLLLPAGIQAKQASSLLGMSEISLSAVERAFVQASLRKARRNERLRLALSILLLALAVLTSALGLAAHAAQQRAERHRTEAESLMAYMLGEFVNKVRPIGRLDLLDSISGRALAYLSDPGERKNDGVSLSQRATALQLIAEVKIARGDPAAARRALLAARDILEQQAATDPRSRELLASRGANAFYLGQIAFDQDDWQEAQRYFEAYRRDSDLLNALAPDDPAAWVEQAYAHNSLGSLALKRGAVREAAQAFALSVELKQKALARKRGDPSLVADLADSLSWLASTREQLGELGAAMDLYRREQALVLPLYLAAPGDGLWSHRYAFALWHQAELQLALGQDDAGAASLRQAAGLLAELVRRDPGNRAWQMDASNVQLKLAELDKSAAVAATLARLDALHREFATLAALEPKKTSLARLAAASLAARAGPHLRAGRPQAARAALAPALAALEGLHAQTASDARLRDALTGAHLLDAASAAAAGDQAGAHASCRRVREILGPEAAASLDFHVLSAWVRAHDCLGEAGKTGAQRDRLAAIGYRDSDYLQSIFPTTATKGTQ